MRIDNVYLYEFELFFRSVVIICFVMFFRSFSGVLFFVEIADDVQVFEDYSKCAPVIAAESKDESPPGVLSLDGQREYVGEERFNTWHDQRLPNRMQAVNLMTNRLKYVTCFEC